MTFEFSREEVSRTEEDGPSQYIKLRKNSGIVYFVITQDK